jgi:hypothetical protein
MSEHERPPMHVGQEGERLALEAEIKRLREILVDLVTWLDQAHGVDPEVGNAPLQAARRAIEIIDAMTVSGRGWGTAPHQVIWFCHVCMWSGMLPAGELHLCKPKKPDAR